MGTTSSLDNRIRLAMANDIIGLLVDFYLVAVPAVRPAGGRGSLCF